MPLPVHRPRGRGCGRPPGCGPTASKWSRVLAGSRPPPPCPSR